MSTVRGSARGEEDRKRLVQIGQDIRLARNRRGLSQEEFAHLAGFSRSYFTEIETGKRNLSVLNLLKIADKLGVSPEELMI